MVGTSRGGKALQLNDKGFKMIPFEVGMTLTKAMSENRELADFARHDADVSEIMEMAFKLEGVVRNVGRHAGGVVIAPTDLTNLCLFSLRRVCFASVSI